MANKNYAGRNKIVAILILLLPAFLLIFLSTRGCSHKFKQLHDFGKLSNYHFKDSRGKQFSSKDFKGKIVIVTTLQKTCPDSCAISMWHLDQTIYQHIRKNRKKLKQVRIISFVTDGKGNEVGDLASLSASLDDNVEAYDPDIWFLAEGNARSVFNVEFKNRSIMKKGNEFFGGEAYLELMLLLDKRNHLRMINRGTDEGSIRRMKQHQALLQKQYDKELRTITHPKK